MQIRRTLGDASASPAGAPRCVVHAGSVRARARVLIQPQSIATYGTVRGAGGGAHARARARCGGRLRVTPHLHLHSADGGDDDSCCLIRRGGASARR